MLMSINLTPEKIQFYKDNGYVVVENVITGELLDNLKKGYNNAVNGCYLENDWEKTWKPDSLLQLPNPHEHIPEFQNKEHIDIIVDIARQLECADIGFWYDQLIYKPTGNKWETPWHQDAGYWQDDEVQKIPQAVTAWLAVEDVDESMGCMSFVPGSHLNGRVNHKNIADKSPIGGALLAEADFSNSVKVPLKAGDVTFHNQYTLHYTSGNSGSRNRCGLVNHLKSFEEI